MRTTITGAVAAACFVALAAAACGSSSGKSSSAAVAAATTSPASQASSSAEATPAAPTSSGPAPLNATQLSAGLLAPSVFGAGFAHAKDWPVTSDETTGRVDDIPSLDCWTVLEEDGARIGSLAQARDTEVSDASDDEVRQDAYQFDSGDAATMMTNFAQKAGQCATYDHTPSDNSTTYHAKAKVETVSGLGDQAVKTTVSDDSAKWGADTSVELDVRYGDVVVVVMFDSAEASKATAYDVAGKAKEIAAKLGLKATGA